MTARRGQVALYLVMVLVGIVFLVLMNVGTYLAVTAKNRAMNAGDAAALAVARHQAELLNEIGRLNLAHVKAVLANDTNECQRVMDEQRRLCFLGPLDGIRIGNEWAKRNGITLVDEEAEQVLRQHVIDIRIGYEQDVEQFPEPWEGAWEEYARALETAIGEGVYAAPDNIDFIDAAGGHLLLNAQFYNAIAGRNWCWFHFNAPGIVESYGGFRDWGPLPVADAETRLRMCANSEIYSLHLMARIGSARTLLGEERLRELSGCTVEDLRNAVLVNDETQVWYFFGRDDLWRTWWEIDPDGDYRLPVVGKVKPEYDVRGCAAVCRVMNKVPDVVLDAGDRKNRWTAAAKPFGLVLDDRGELLYDGLVLSVFTDVRLVPWDSVGGRDTERPNLSMVTHVRKHLPTYLQNGSPGLSSGCYYCDQLRLWELPSLHAEARNWLKFNSQTCIRAVHAGGHRGGTPHAH